MKHVSEFEVRSFRNVRPTTLRFRPGLNVVLGKNAAGKTSLLNLLSDVLASFSADERTTRVVVRDGEDVLTRSDLVTATRSGDGPRPLVFGNDMQLEARLSAGSFSARVHDGAAELDGVRLPNGRDALLTLLSVLSRRSEALATRFVSMLWSDARRLDESLDYFNELLAFTQTRKGSEVESNLWSGLPASLREFELQHAADVGPYFSAPFLDRAAKVMGYQSAQGRVDVESKTTAGKSETRFANLRFAFSAGQDTFTHSSLSYGEKRLLAFFAMCDACPDVVIADELVNGLHHEWIQACIAELRGRQAFLTSQNPLLLDYLEFDSPTDVQHGFVLCERTAARAELVWRNPTEDEAKEFFAAYQTGIQTVSEILIAKGFW